MRAPTSGTNDDFIERRDAVCADLFEDLLCAIDVTERAEWWMPCGKRDDIGPLACRSQFFGNFTDAGVGARFVFSIRIGVYCRAEQLIEKDVTGPVVRCALLGDAFF